MKIFADYERYNLFQFSAKMNFNGGDITRTHKQGKHIIGVPSFSAKIPIFYLFLCIIAVHVDYF